MDPWRRIDLDDDGALSFDELLAFAPAGWPKTTLESLFETLDRNEDEQVSLIELEAALGR